MLANVQVSVLTIDTSGACCERLAMSRKLRMEYPGAMYHVMNRGDQREEIFRDDEDRQQFLSPLGEACAKTEWPVQAYCLMRNHGHLVLATPSPTWCSG